MRMGRGNGKRRVSGLRLASGMAPLEFRVAERT